MRVPKAGIGDVGSSGYSDRWYPVNADFTRRGTVRTVMNANTTTFVCYTSDSSSASWGTRTINETETDAGLFTVQLFTEVDYTASTGNVGPIAVGPALGLELEVSTAALNFARSPERVFVQFYVAKEWTVKEFFFKGTCSTVNEGCRDAETEMYRRRFSSARGATALRLSITGNEGWGFWQIKFDGDVVLEHPNGVTASAWVSTSDDCSRFWLDGNGCSGSSTEVSLAFNAIGGTAKYSKFETDFSQPVWPDRTKPAYPWSLTSEQEEAFEGWFQFEEQNTRPSTQIFQWFASEEDPVFMIYALTMTPGGPIFTLPAGFKVIPADKITYCTKLTYQAWRQAATELAVYYQKMTSPGTITVTAINGTFGTTILVPSASLVQALNAASLATSTSTTASTTTATLRGATTTLTTTTATYTQVYRYDGEDQFVLDCKQVSCMVGRTLDQCKAVCTLMNSECDGFNWREQGNCCLKDCGSAFSTRVAADELLGVYSGTSTGWNVYIRQLGDATFSKIDDRKKCPKDARRPDCSNGGISCNFETVNGCFLECLEVDRCTHFSYSQKQGTCILCSEIPSEFFSNDAGNDYPDAKSYEVTSTTKTSTTATTPTTATTMYDPGNVDCVEKEDDCTAACQRAADRNYAVRVLAAKLGKVCAGPTDCQPGEGTCMHMSTTTATTTTTAKTTTAKHPCNNITCAVICNGECGWSRAEEQCKPGLITSQSMIDSNLGDCSVSIPDNVANSASSAGSGGVIGGAVGVGLFLIAVIAVSICVARKKRALNTRPAAANRNRAPRPRRSRPPTANTPALYGPAVASTNPTFTTAGASPIYEEIADGVPAITATAAATTTDDTYGLDTLYGAGHVQPPISALYLEPTPLSTFQNADGVVYSTYADAASPTNTQPRVVLRDSQPPSRQQQQQPRSGAATDDDDNYEMPSDQVLSTVVNGIKVPTRLSRNANAKGSSTSRPVSKIFKSDDGSGESRSDKSRPVPMLNLNLQNLEQGDDSTLVIRPLRALSTPRTFGTEETVLGTPSSMKASYFFASSTPVEADDKPPSRQTSNV